MMVPLVMSVGEVETTTRQEGSISRKKTGSTTRHGTGPGRGIRLLCAGWRAKATGIVASYNSYVVLRILAFLAILTGEVHFTQVTTAPASPQLEADVERAMKVDTAPFAERAAMVDRLDDARGRATGESAARLSLLWLRGVKWMLASIPLAERDGEPHNDWIKQHSALVIFSEPAGDWLIVPDVIWKIHDQHRRSPLADEIAWLAVTNGLAGECEGYVPCSAHGLNTLDGEYLRRHPLGAHVAEAVETTKSSLEQSLRLLSEPDGQQFFDASRDCSDLKPPLSELRQALAGSAAGPAREETLAIADQLLAMCPS
jgi:hypothetical protein